MTLFKHAGLSAFLFSLLFLAGCGKEAVTTISDEKTEASPIASLSAAAKAKNGPIGACYVEVNSNNILNTGCYTLKNGGQPLFDIAIIFAGNINYDTGAKKAVLYNNPQVTTVLTGKDTYIKPLQQKGIKVMLSILGNHQGAGVSNFTSRFAALDFAKQLATAVKTYGLDGIDFDDEYADYGNNGLPQPNDSSFTILVAELRRLLPTKLITFYYYGPAISSLTYKRYRAGDYLNYAWNPYYGSFLVPNVPGMDSSQYAPAADWINNTPLATAKNLATKTINGGYGAYLYYDLTNTPSQNYLSGISNILYKDSVSLATGCLQTFP